MKRRAGPHTRTPITRTSFLLIVAATGVAVGAGACAPKMSPLPGGPGTPFDGYAAAYEQATERCRGVRTYAGVLGLSGRAGDTPIRGRVDAGFAEPGLIRLEGRPPALAFGRPFFILVGRADDALLLLPRDNRVLTGHPTEAVVEALTGVALTADELRAVVGGCGLGVVEPSSGRAYEGGLVALDTGGSSTWLRNREGGWRPFATIRGPLEIRYEEFDGAYPTRIRIRTAPVNSGTRTDITLRASDVDINTELGPEVFRETVPGDATPITLEELRRARIQG